MLTGYKKNGNGFVEVDVHVDKDGEPILHDNVILAKPPLPKEGFRLTIENNRWIYVAKSPATKRELDLVKSDLRSQFERWKYNHINAPIIFRGLVFHADEETRLRIVGAISGYREFKRIPAGWAAMGGRVVMPLTVEYLRSLADVIDMAFQVRFFEARSLELKIEESVDINSLINFTFPPIPTYASLMDEIRKSNETGVVVPPRPVRIIPDFPLSPNIFINEVTTPPSFEEGSFETSFVELSPGLPDGNDTYHSGLKLIRGMVKEKIRIIYNLDTISQFFDDHIPYCIIQKVVGQKKDFSEGVVSEYIKDEDIVVDLKPGEQLWLGVVLGRPRTYNEDGLPNDWIYDLTDLTLGSVIMRVTEVKLD